MAGRWSGGDTVSHGFRAENRYQASHGIHDPECGFHPMQNHGLLELLSLLSIFIPSDGVFTPSIDLLILKFCAVEVIIQVWGMISWVGPPPMVPNRGYPIIIKHNKNDTRQTFKPGDQPPHLLGNRQLVLQYPRYGLRTIIHDLAAHSEMHHSGILGHGKAIYATDAVCP